MKTIYLSLYIIIVVVVRIIFNSTSS